jgi:hypothetical protein
LLADVCSADKGLIVLAVDDKYYVLVILANLDDKLVGLAMDG